MTGHKPSRRAVVRGTAALLAGGAVASTVTAKQNRNGGGGGGGSSGGSLSDAEREGLLYVREEEKLAHDLYVTLFEEWGLEIFGNISHSEQRHMDAVKDLLDKYDLDDPILDGRGEFSNDDLQALYDDLVSRGRESEVEALRVGGYVEETDIVDLQEEIDVSDNDDIDKVYGKLREGSKNHLRAFVDKLESYGITYEPQVLDEATYQQILDE